MAADMNGHDVKSSVVALYGMIVRPSATLCHISENPTRYLVPSVAVFACSVSLAVLIPPAPFGDQMWETTWDGTAYSLIITAMQNLMPILGIFWIGKRWGGNRRLGRAFSALAYCAVPGILGGIVSVLALGLSTHAFPEIAHHDGLVAGSSYGYSTIQFVMLFFLGWSLLLYVKAIRALNGFGYVRSVAILVLGVLVMYAASLIHGLVSVAIIEFVL